MTDIVERLRAPAYWISGSSEGHEGENNAPYEAAAEIERLRAALRGVLEEAAKVAEDNEPEPSKEEMDDSYDAVAAYRVGRWEAAGDIATAIRALKEGK